MKEHAHIHIPSNNNLGTIYQKKKKSTYYALCVLWDIPVWGQI